MRSPRDTPNTEPDQREVCSIRLVRHGWLRPILTYEATRRHAVIKRSGPIPHSGEDDASSRALMDLVGELRREGWEPLPYADALPAGVLSRYSRPVCRGTP
jgi:hypothetical protein